MQAQSRRPVLDLEPLRPVKALSRLFGASSRHPGKALFNFECATGGHEGALATPVDATVTVKRCNRRIIRWICASAQLCNTTEGARERLGRIPISFTKSRSVVS
jgi:hypothetical protein